MGRGGEIKERKILKDRGDRKRERWCVEGKGSEGESEPVDEIKTLEPQVHPTRVKTIQSCGAIETFKMVFYLLHVSL